MVFSTFEGFIVDSEDTLGYFPNMDFTGIYIVNDN